MTVRRFIALVLMFSVMAAIVIACGSPAPQPPANPPANPVDQKTNVEVAPIDPQIYLLEPDVESLVVTSPFNLRVGVANFKIPIQDMRIHIAIDAACATAGEVINPDAQHVSLPPGKMEEPRFNLPVGKHRLCLQVSNRDNVVLEGPGLTRVYDIEVVP